MPNLSRRLVLLATLLHAQLAAADSPWETGVGEATRAKAQALFEEANVLFAQQAHAPALEKYKAAIALWDHPLIRLNKAVTELRLDRVLDAADDLDAALRYGKMPFTDAEYQNLLEQQKVIAGKIGHVEASCTEPDAQVLLDGEPWLSCPGSGKRRVLAGRHALLGQKQGFVPVARQLTIAVGDRAVESIVFQRDVPAGPSGPSSATPGRPLWRSPWLWGGAAVLAAGVGTSYRLYANKEQERIDALTANSAAHEFSDVQAVLDRGDRRAALSTSFYVGAGALAITAVVFAVLPPSPPSSDRGALARLRVDITATSIGATWAY